MTFISRYTSHQPDAKGLINYSPLENQTWKTLYQRQSALLRDHASDAFIQGFKRLDLNPEAIPQLPALSKKIEAYTGWQISPVAALISAREFFQLLAEKKFPAATFIRVPEEIDYIQEPDIFHELFGHAPMLTDTVYADFLCTYAKKVLSFPEDNWPLLQRLFWFTVEFGLINDEGGLRAYGGGILSSIGETPYSVKSDIPLRILFDPVAAFRMPYRIDQLQRVYFVIDSYEVLYNFVNKDIDALIQTARELGEFPAFFPVDKNNPNIHIYAC